MIHLEDQSSSRLLVMSGLTTCLGIGGFLLTRYIMRKIRRRVAALARSGIGFLQKLTVIKRLKAYFRRTTRKRPRGRVISHHVETPSDSVSPIVGNDNCSDTAAERQTLTFPSDSVSPRVGNDNFSDTAADIACDTVTDKGETLTFPSDSVSPRVGNDNFSDTAADIACDTVTDKGETLTFPSDSVSPKLDNKDFSDTAADIACDTVTDRRETLTFPSDSVSPRVGNDNFSDTTADIACDTVTEKGKTQNFLCYRVTPEDIEDFSDITVEFTYNTVKEILPSECDYKSYHKSRVSEVVREQHPPPISLDYLSHLFSSKLLISPANEFIAESKLDHIRKTYHLDCSQSQRDTSDTADQKTGTTGGTSSLEYTIEADSEIENLSLKVQKSEDIIVVINVDDPGQNKTSFDTKPMLHLNQKEIENKQHDEEKQEFLTTMDLDQTLTAESFAEDTKNEPENILQEQALIDIKSDSGKKTKYYQPISDKSDIKASSHLRHKKKNAKKRKQTKRQSTPVRVKQNIDLQPPTDNILTLPEYNQQEESMIDILKDDLPPMKSVAEMLNEQETSETTYEPQSSTFMSEMDVKNDLVTETPSPITLNNLTEMISMEEINKKSHSEVQKVIEGDSEIENLSLKVQKSEEIIVVINVDDPGQNETSFDTKPMLDLNQKESENKQHDEEKKEFSTTMDLDQTLTAESFAQDTKNEPENILQEQALIDIKSDSGKKTKYYQPISDESDIKASSHLRHKKKNVKKRKQTKRQSTPVTVKQNIDLQPTADNIVTPPEYNEQEKSMIDSLKNNLPPMKSVAEMLNEQETSETAYEPQSSTLTSEMHVKNDLVTETTPSPISLNNLTELIPMEEINKKSISGVQTVIEADNEIENLSLKVQKSEDMIVVLNVDDPGQNETLFDTKPMLHLNQKESENKQHDEEKQEFSTTMDLDKTLTAESFAEDTKNEPENILQEQALIDIKSDSGKKTKYSQPISDDSNIKASLDVSYKKKKVKKRKQTKRQSTPVPVKENIDLQTPADNIVTLPEYNQQEESMIDILKDDLPPMKSVAEMLNEQETSETTYEPQSSTFMSEMDVKNDLVTETPSPITLNNLTEMISMEEINKKSHSEVQKVIEGDSEIENLSLKVQKSEEIIVVINVDDPGQNETSFDTKPMLDLNQKESENKQHDEEKQEFSTTMDLDQTLTAESFAQDTKNEPENILQEQALIDIKSDSGKKTKYYQPISDESDIKASSHLRHKKKNVKKRKQTKRQSTPVPVKENIDLQPPADNIVTLPEYNQQEESMIDILKDDLPPMKSVAEMLNEQETSETTYEPQSSTFMSEMDVKNDLVTETIPSPITLNNVTDMISMEEINKKSNSEVQKVIEGDSEIENLSLKVQKSEEIIVVINVDDPGQNETSFDTKPMLDLNQKESENKQHDEEKKEFSTTMDLDQTLTAESFAQDTKNEPKNILQEQALIDIKSDSGRKTKYSQPISDESDVILSSHLTYKKKKVKKCKQTKRQSTPVPVKENIDLQPPADNILTPPEYNQQEESMIDSLKDDLPPMKSVAEMLNEQETSETTYEPQSSTFMSEMDVKNDLVTETIPSPITLNNLTEMISIEEINKKSNSEVQTVIEGDSEIENLSLKVQKSEEIIVVINVDDPGQNETSFDTKPMLDLNQKESENKQHDEEKQEFSTTMDLDQTLTAEYFAEDTKNEPENILQEQALIDIKSDSGKKTKYSQPISDDSDIKASLDVSYKKKKVKKHKQTKRQSTPVPVKENIDLQPPADNILTPPEYNQQEESMIDSLKDDLPPMKSVAEMLNEQETSETTYEPQSLTFMSEMDVKNDLVTETIPSPITLNNLTEIISMEEINKKGNSEVQTVIEGDSEIENLSLKVQKSEEIIVVINVDDPGQTETSFDTKPMLDLNQKESENKQHDEEKKEFSTTMDLDQTLTAECFAQDTKNEPENILQEQALIDIKSDSGKKTKYSQPISDESDVILSSHLTYKKKKVKKCKQTKRQSTPVPVKENIDLQPPADNILTPPEYNQQEESMIDSLKDDLPPMKSVAEMLNEQETSETTYEPQSLTFMSEMDVKNDLVTETIPSPITLNNLTEMISMEEINKKGNSEVQTVIEGDSEIENLSLKVQKSEEIIVVINVDDPGQTETSFDTKPMLDLNQKESENKQHDEKKKEFSTTMDLDQTLTAECFAQDTKNEPENILQEQALIDIKSDSGKKTKYSQPISDESDVILSSHLTYKKKKVKKCKQTKRQSTPVPVKENIDLQPPADNILTPPEYNQQEESMIDSLKDDLPPMKSVAEMLNEQETTYEPQSSTFMSEMDVKNDLVTETIPSPITLNNLTEMISMEEINKKRNSEVQTVIEGDSEIENLSLKLQKSEEITVVINVDDPGQNETSFDTKPMLDLNQKESENKQHDEEKQEFSTTMDLDQTLTAESFAEDTKNEPENILREQALIDIKSDSGKKTKYSQPISDDSDIKASLDVSYKKKKVKKRKQTKRQSTPVPVKENFDLQPSADNIVTLPEYNHQEESMIDILKDDLPPMKSVADMLNEQETSETTYEPQSSTFMSEMDVKKDLVTETIPSPINLNNVTEIISMEEINKKSNSEVQTVIEGDSEIENLSLKVQKSEDIIVVINVDDPGQNETSFDTEPMLHLYQNECENKQHDEEKEEVSTTMDLDQTLTTESIAHDMKNEPENILQKQPLTDFKYSSGKKAKYSHPISDKSDVIPSSHLTYKKKNVKKLKLTKRQSTPVTVKANIDLQTPTDNIVTLPEYHEQEESMTDSLKDDLPPMKSVEKMLNEQETSETAYELQSSTFMSEMHVKNDLVAETIPSPISLNNLTELIPMEEINKKSNSEVQTVIAGDSEIENLSLKVQKSEDIIVVINVDDPGQNETSFDTKPMLHLYQNESENKQHDEEKEEVLTKMDVDQTLTTEYIAHDMKNEPENILQKQPLIDIKYSSGKKAKYSHPISDKSDVIPSSHLTYKKKNVKKRKQAKRQSTTVAVKANIDLQTPTDNIVTPSEYHEQEESMIDSLKDDLPPLKSVAEMLNEQETSETTYEPQSSTFMSEMDVKNDLVTETIPSPITLNNLTEMISMEEINKKSNSEVQTVIDGNSVFENLSLKVQKSEDIIVVINVDDPGQNETSFDTNPMLDLNQKESENKQHREEREEFSTEMDVDQTLTTESIAYDMRNELKNILQKQPLTDIKSDSGKKTKYSQPISDESDIKVSLHLSYKKKNVKKLKLTKRQSTPVTVKEMIDLQPPTDNIVTLPVYHEQEESMTDSLKDDLPPMKSVAEMLNEQETSETAYELQSSTFMSEMHVKNDLVTETIPSPISLNNLTELIPMEEINKKSNSEVQTVIAGDSEIENLSLKVQKSEDIIVVINVDDPGQNETSFDTKPMLHLYQNESENKQHDKEKEEVLTKMDVNQTLTTESIAHDMKNEPENILQKQPLTDIKYSSGKKAKYSHPISDKSDVIPSSHLTYKKKNVKKHKQAKRQSTTVAVKANIDLQTPTDNIVTPPEYHEQEESMIDSLKDDLPPMKSVAEMLNEQETSETAYELQSSTFMPEMHVKNDLVTETIPSPISLGNLTQLISMEDINKKSNSAVETEIEADSETLGTESIAHDIKNELENIMQEQQLIDIKSNSDEKDVMLSSQLSHKKKNVKRQKQREESMQLVNTHDISNVNNTNFNETISPTTMKVAISELGGKKHIAEIYGSLESLCLEPPNLSNTIYERFQVQKHQKRKGNKPSKKCPQRKKNPARPKVQKNQDLNIMSFKKTCDTVIDIQMLNIKPVTEPKPACDTKSTALEIVYEEGSAHPNFAMNKDTPNDTAELSARFRPKNISNDPSEMPSSSFMYDVEMEEDIVMDYPLQIAEKISVCDLPSPKLNKALTNLQQGDLREQKQTGSVMGEEQPMYLTPEQKKMLKMKGARGMLDDDIINNAQDLLKKQFQGFDGLQPTAVLLIGGYHARKHTVQIHYDEERSHWLTSCFNGNTVMIADSIKTKKLPDSIRRQIESLYGEVVKQPLKKLKFLDVHQQPNNYDCGLFAIANAFEFLAQDGNPTCRYQHKQMRTHLIECLEKGTITAFPKKA